MNSRDDGLTAIESELARYDWKTLPEIGGTSEDIPVAFMALLNSQTPKEAEAAYWRLENHVVVQGSLFESALALVPSICLALSTDTRPSHVKIMLLEILFQILNGEPDVEAVARGNSDLHLRCMDVVRPYSAAFERYHDHPILGRASREVSSLIHH